MPEDAAIHYRPTTQQIADSARQLAHQIVTLPPHEAASVLAAFLADLEACPVVVVVTVE